MSAGSTPYLSPECSQVSAKGSPWGWKQTKATTSCFLPEHSVAHGVHLSVYLCVYTHVCCSGRVCLWVCVSSPHSPSLGLPADEAGIKVNDIILEVEGIDVTRASGQVVVDLIR